MRHWAQNGTKRAMLAVATLALVAFSLPAPAELAKPLHRFVAFYEVTESASSSFWERLLFSMVLLDSVPEQRCDSPTQFETGM
jgi:hypothetical protein